MVALTPLGWGYVGILLVLAALLVALLRRLAQTPPPAVEAHEPAPEVPRTDGEAP